MSILSTKQNIGTLGIFSLFFSFVFKNYAKLNNRAGYKSVKNDNNSNNLHLIPHLKINN